MKILLHCVPKVYMKMYNVYLKELFYTFDRKVRFLVLIKKWSGVLKYSPPSNVRMMTSYNIKASPRLIIRWDWSRHFTTSFIVDQLVFKNVLFIYLSNLKLKNLRDLFYVKILVTHQVSISFTLDLVNILHVLLFFVCFFWRINNSSSSCYFSFVVIMRIYLEKQFQRIYVIVRCVMLNEPRKTFVQNWRRFLFRRIACWKEFRYLFLFSLGKYFSRQMLALYFHLHVKISLYFPLAKPVFNFLKLKKYSRE